MDFMQVTSDSIGGSPPASIKRIFQLLISLKRAATIEPAVPAPTTMKSYSSKPIENRFELAKKSKSTKFKMIYHDFQITLNLHNLLEN